MTTSLFEHTLSALLSTDPEAKCALTSSLREQWLAGNLTLAEGPAPREIPIPGRPEKPLLVHPRELPKRNKLQTAEGRACLLHALAHIEFNAINLALDAVYRFRDLPTDYYSDWLGVAAEEAYHFQLLQGHLHTLGFAYGDFAAHNGLWEMAIDTAHDALIRMALVPRVLEARGLDVTPALIQKLESANDHAAADILRIIRRDEIGHVAVGTRWYRHLCQTRDLDPATTFFELVERYLKGKLKGPFNFPDRIAAGFDAEEIQRLEHWP